MDWNEIRKEYIQGGISYRELAAKYGVPLPTLSDRAKAEKWVELRRQAHDKSIAKTVDAVSRQIADVDSSIHDAAMALLEAFNVSVQVAGGLNAKQLRDYGAALKSIQDVLTNGPSDLDIREQEARIEKLRREAEKTDNAGSGKVTVQMEGDIDGFSG